MRGGRAGERGRSGGRENRVEGLFASHDEVHVRLGHVTEPEGVAPMLGEQPTSVSDCIQGEWETREVYLAGGRLKPSESLAVARHSAHGFGWGDGGSGAAQLALALLLRATGRASAVAHYQAFKWEVIARLPQADFRMALSAVRDWLASRSAP